VCAGQTRSGKAHHDEKAVGPRRAAGAPGAGRGRGAAARRARVTPPLRGGQARDNAVVRGRGALLARQAPGVGEALLAFCDARGGAAFRFPWYGRWAPLVEALLEQARARDIGLMYRDRVKRFPWYARWTPLVEALLEQARARRGAAVQGLC
jgi:hypothetical protein